MAVHCTKELISYPIPGKEAKIIAEYVVRPFELRGRITACVVGSIVGSAQVLVGL
jgi:hypothetical protein